MDKILISAYACEPNKGSEPEVGWQWIYQLSNYYEIWVLTKGNNKDTIDTYIKNNKIEINNIHFIYVDLPKSLTFWKKGNRGMRLYYYLWQKKALSIAKQYHNIYNFKLAHSITFVSYTQPCFLYKLNIPLFWTIAGGENISKKIKYPLTFKERTYEIIRKIGQKKTMFSLATNKMFKYSNCIFATTYETFNRIPKKYRNKVIITSAIGIKNKQKIKNEVNDDKVRVLLVGKFIYLKGMDIGVKAILKIAEKCNNVYFDVLGNGKYLNKCKKIVNGKYNNRINFIEKIEHDKMYDFYKEHDILINTALRDSGCFVVMEAMSVGVPTVCINTGGVKEMTTTDTSIKVDPCKYDEMIDKLALGVIELVNNKELRKKLGHNSYERINSKYLYNIKVLQIVEQYKKAIDLN